MIKCKAADVTFTSFAQLLVEVLGDLVQELEGVEVVGPGDVGHSALDAEGQVFGHITGLDRLNAHGLQRLSEMGQLKSERKEKG